MNAGILPRPGFTYTNMEINYNTDTLNDPSRNAVPPKPTLNLWVVENIFTFVPNAKFLGGNLGFTIMVPTIANGSLTLEQVNFNGSTYGLADTWNLALFFKHEHEYTAYSHTLGNTLVSADPGPCAYLKRVERSDGN